MLWLQEHTPLALRWFKVGFDIFCVIAGALMGGAFGIGTVSAAFLSGPAMCVVLKLMGRDPEGGQKQ